MRDDKEQVIVVTAGNVEGTNCVYEFVLGFCEGRVFPYITIDYHQVSGGGAVGCFGGRSPRALIQLLKERSYPVPVTLEKWAAQAQQVTISMLSGSEDMTLVGLEKYYTEVLTKEKIKKFIRKEMSESFQEATIALALHTYWGIKAAKIWNADLDQMLSTMDNC